MLSPKVVDLLLAAKVGPGEELYLTPAIHQLSKTDRVLVHSIEGTWHTTGDPLRFMKANVEYMLRSQEFGADFAAHLRELAQSGVLSRY